jgi:hypothetical protein
MTKKKNKTANHYLAHLQVAPANPRPKLAKELNACPPASWIVLCFILTTFFFVDMTTAQNQSQNLYDRYKNYGENYIIQQQNELNPPMLYPYGYVENPSITLLRQTLNDNNGNNAQTIINQSNKQAKQAMGYNPPLTQEEIKSSNNNNFGNNQLTSRQKDFSKILNDIKSAETNKHVDFTNYYSQDFAAKTKPYYDALQTLNDMLSGKTQISLRKALYIMEAAYGNSYISYKEYSDIIDNAVFFMKAWLKQNNYDSRNNENLNMAIQKLMGDSLVVTLKYPDNKKPPETIMHLPIFYDFDDYTCEADIRNSFATKCIATGAGQCDGLPKNYLLYAEGLGAKAYLSFIPQHSFIKYPDNKGKIHNYEPTSHWNIDDEWYKDYMRVRPEAINSKIYFDTLNKQMIVAQCILDLASNYMRKNDLGDEKFLIECLNSFVKYYPKRNNIFPYFIKTSIILRQLERLLISNGINDLKDMDKIEGARELYNSFIENEKVIQALGYQDTPDKLYEEIMQEHEFKGAIQKGKSINGKQKRNLFIKIK